MFVTKFIAYIHTVAIKVGDETDCGDVGVSHEVVIKKGEVIVFKYPQEMMTEGSAYCFAFIFMTTCFLLIPNEPFLLDRV